MSDYTKLAPVEVVCYTHAVRAAFVAVAALLAASCAAVGERREVPQPAQADAALTIIGVSIKARKIDPFAERAETCHVVPVTAAGELDIDHPIRSDKAHGGWIFFFNLPPGRYAPVAFTYRRRAKRFLARLEPAVSRAWAFEVKRGGIAFAGDNFLRREFPGWGQTVQNFLKTFRFLAPPFKRGVVRLPLSGPRVDRSWLAELRALRAARKGLAGTLWTGWIDARLKEMGNPQEPLTKRGFFRRKPVPYLKTEWFSYHDVFDWGPPIKVRGGLEWRHPQGRARVAAVFLRPGDPGYKPADEYLRDLKQAGSPEDSHALHAVLVSSRPAWSAIYTLYDYPEPYLTGSKVRVLVTETVVVPDTEDLYLFRLRAEREHFRQARERFKRFLGYVVLQKPVATEAP